MRAITRFFAHCLALLIAGVLLASCQETNSPSATHTPLPGIPASPWEAPIPRGTQSPTLIDLQRDYEVLSEAHATMTTIWESLAAGETAQCGQYPDLVAPGSISADDDTALEPLADLLRQASIGLDTSLDLWQAECMKTRANPGPEIINQGRLATRAAGDALNAAAPMLSDIQAR